MLFWAFLAWYLGQLSRSNPAAIGPLGWAFFLVQIPGVVLAFLYFGLPAVVFSGVVTAIVGWAAWLASTKKVVLG